MSLRSRSYGRFIVDFFQISASQNLQDYCVQIQVRSGLGQLASELILLFILFYGNAIARNIICSPEAHISFICSSFFYSIRLSCKMCFSFAWTYPVSLYGMKNVYVNESAWNTWNSKSCDAFSWYILTPWCEIVGYKAAISNQINLSPISMLCFLHSEECFFARNAFSMCLCIVLLTQYSCVPPQCNVFSNLIFKFW